jgi:hypothetical protein
VQPTLGPAFSIVTRQNCSMFWYGHEVRVLKCRET